MSRDSTNPPICIRYKSVGVEVDTDKWKVVIDDPAERW